VAELIRHERITTTLAKAKETRVAAEKLITHGKKGTLHHRRLALAQVPNTKVVKKVFDDVAPRYTERAGGYTRIIKLGPRQGDAAAMALIELV
jgi:large subunit ribosomal protein L17